MRHRATGSSVSARVLDAQVFSARQGNVAIQGPRVPGAEGSRHHGRPREPPHPGPVDSARLPSGTDVNAVPPWIRRRCVMTHRACGSPGGTTSGAERCRKAPGAAFIDSAATRVEKLDSIQPRLFRARWPRRRSGALAFHFKRLSRVARARHGNRRHPSTQKTSRAGWRGPWIRSVVLISRAGA